MGNLKGKKVRLNERLYNKNNISTYTENGYFINHVYEVIDEKYDYGTVVQLKNKDEDRKSFWIEVGYVDVFKDESESILHETSLVLQERKEKIIRDIEELKNEYDEVDKTLGYLRKIKDGI